MSDPNHNEPDWMPNAKGIGAKHERYAASNAERQAMALEIGRDLNNIRPTIKHGEWGDFLKVAKFKVGAKTGKSSTADKWMDLAKWGATVKSPQCGDLDNGKPVEMPNPATGAPGQYGGLNEAHEAGAKAIRLKKSGERKAEREARKPIEGIALRVIDIEDLLKEIEPNSVHAIITDPPYEEAAIGLWGVLGELAAKALVPGGQLVALSGKISLPKVFAQLEAVEGIQYRWTFSWSMDGGSMSRILAANAIQTWKPALVYRKPPKDKDREPFGKDSVVSVQEEEQGQHHHWGQQTGTFHKLLERFCWPGDTVLDPFLGGGTTALCARRRGCAFQGSDIDESCILTTQERLDEED